MEKNREYIEQSKAQEFEEIFEQRNESIKETARMLRKLIETSSLSDEEKKRGVDYFQKMSEDPLSVGGGRDKEGKLVGETPLYSCLTNWGRNFFSGNKMYELARSLAKGTTYSSSSLVEVWETFKKEMYDRHGIFVIDQPFISLNLSNHRVFKGKVLAPTEREKIVVEEILKPGFKPGAKVYGDTRAETFFRHGSQSSVFEKAHVIIDVMENGAISEAKKRYTEKIEALLQEAQRSREKKTKITSEEKTSPKEIEEKLEPLPTPQLYETASMADKPAEEPLTSENYEGVAEKQKLLLEEVKEVYRDVFPILNRVDISSPFYDQTQDILSRLRDLQGEIAIVSAYPVLLNQWAGAFLKILDDLDSLSEKISE